MTRWKSTKKFSLLRTDPRSPFSKELSVDGSLATSDTKNLSIFKNCGQSDAVSEAKLACWVGFCCSYIFEGRIVCHYGIYKYILRMNSSPSGWWMRCWVMLLIFVNRRILGVHFCFLIVRYFRNFEILKLSHSVLSGF